MTLVALGIDALDPDLVDPDVHPNLALKARRSIGTIPSHTGEPSTHELWPTIITGLSPDEHGLTLDDGVAWENPILGFGASVADVAIPDGLQTRIGAWLLNNTEQDAFRVPATYYDEQNLSTVFDGRTAEPIGIPNYVVEPDEEDREHTLRRSLGTLFERDPDATGGHTSSDPSEFYQLCMEMSMIRIARARRALRAGRYELVFAYTSGLDLIGHVTYDRPDLHEAAYEEMDDFVGELVHDLGPDDELLLVSDHGLQDGVHTDEAMVAGTTAALVEAIEDVRDVRGAIDRELDEGSHAPSTASGGGDELDETGESDSDDERADEVRSRLEDLGYM